MTSPAGYYRHPTIHDDTIVFVCEEDLWAVSARGGTARRLTAGPGHAATPSLSPDGRFLAYTGTHEGNAEVYVMAAEGGESLRRTWLGCSMFVCGWTPEGRILFSSNAGQPFQQLMHLYTISPDGGRPEPCNAGIAVSASCGPDGGLVIGRHTIDPARWKRYRGGTAGDLWIDANGKGEFQRLPTLPGNLVRPMWIDDRIWFVSDHEGTANLYSFTIAGADLKRHTHHDDFFVRFPSTDGKSIVYQAGADLYRFNIRRNRSELVPIALHSPRTQLHRRFVDPARHCEDVALHPKNHLLALVTRGKCFTMGNWEGPVLRHGEPNGVRYRLPRWLNDGKRFIVANDEEGETLEIRSDDETLPPRRLVGLDIGRPLEMKVSPKADHVVLSNHRNELVHVDLEKGKARVLDSSYFAPIGGFDWSSDGRWVAYSRAETRHTSIIRICRIDTGESHPVTRPVLQDISPAFDPDGKYLYFLSLREFDPVYDGLHFDLGFPKGVRPYLVVLRRDLSSPFVPVPKPTEEPGTKNAAAGEAKPASQEHHEDGSQEQSGDSPASSATAVSKRLQKKGSKKDAKSVTNLCVSSSTGSSSASSAAAGISPNSANQTTENSAAKPVSKEGLVEIDFNGIQDRVLVFPVPDGRYQKIAGIKGKAIFTSVPVEGSLSTSPFGSSEPPSRAILEMFDFETRKTEPIISGISGFTLSVDRKLALLRIGNRLRIIKAGEKSDETAAKEPASRKSGWIDLSRIRVSLDPKSEWRQMFREAWRLQRDHFWTEDLSGVDWQGIYNRYYPLLERVTTRVEFSDLLWEMQGELGTSHAYEFGGDHRPSP
ncbi:MAG: peptidase, partial [Candidatus Ozemobacteraceae bacterium]